MHERTPQRRFGDDGRGQMLILTGVLLVLGFVVLGSTFVQLQSVEENTARVQRDSLVDTVNGLVVSFNATVRDLVSLGQTNITDFQEQVRQAEDRMQGAAIRSGVYMEVELIDNPPTSIFWRDSRCGGYDALRSDEGVIIGYEKETSTESIVGAVYQVIARDGIGEVDVRYYIKVFDCLPRATLSFTEDVTITYGSSSKRLASHSEADLEAFMSLKEELTGETQTIAFADIDPLSVQTNFWSVGHAITDDDSVEAFNIASNPGNHVQFSLDPASAMQADDVATNVTIRIDAREELGAGANDDFLVLNATYTEGASTYYLEWPLSVTTTEQTYFVYAENGPKGAGWTRAEIDDTVWEIKVVRQGGNDPSHFFYVDFFNVTSEFVTPIGYRIDLELDWPQIPPIYEDHDLFMRYKVVPGTTGERFAFQVWQESTSSWQNRTQLQDDLSGNWQTFAYTLLPDEYNDNQPRFRIYDAEVHTDVAATDRDEIQIEFLRIESQADPQQIP